MSDGDPTIVYCSPSDLVKLAIKTGDARYAKQARELAEVWCHRCQRQFRDGDTCHFGGCPKGGDF